MIWIVEGLANHGEYEDETSWLVCACLTKEAAIRIADEARAELTGTTYTVDLTGRPKDYSASVVRYYVTPVEMRE